jgi:hypothetical protein
MRTRITFFRGGVLRTVASLFATTLLVAGPAFADAVPYLEEWDVSGDLAGWSDNGVATTVAVVDSGGNPGGYLYSFGTAGGTLDIGAGTTDTVTAILGDYGGSLWTISFDLQFISGNFDNAWLRLQGDPGGGTNGWLYDLTDEFPIGGQWTSFAVTFDPSWSDIEANAGGWVPLSAVFAGAQPSSSWSATMSDLLRAEIRLSAEGFSEAGIDNYRSTPVPEPGTLLLMSTGLAALWRVRRRRKKR